MYKTLKPLLVLFLLLFFSCKEKKTNLDTKKNKKENLVETKTEFKSEKTTQSHLAKAQYYRWYQLYERPMNELRIANQMDMFIDTIVIKSAAGVMKGKENYPERLTAYKGWKNAHHVQNVKVITNEEGQTQIIADIKYQNIQPDGKKGSYTIDYLIDVENNLKELPKLLKVSIKPTGETQDIFKDAYPNNRVNSLMYYWIANMEQLDGNVKPFKELLTEEFQLNFSTSSKINNLSELETWLNGTPTQLTQSSHHPENLHIKVIDEKTFEVSVAFDWYAIAKNGQKMKAKTQHKWIVIDNPNEKFARIKKADVSQIEPLSMVK